MTTTRQDHDKALAARIDLYHRKNGGELNRDERRLEQRYTSTCDSFLAQVPMSEWHKSLPVRFI